MEKFKCNKCLQFKYETEFNKSNTTKRPVQHTCKICLKPISSKYYKENKELLYKKSRKFRKKYIAQWYAWLKVEYGNPVHCEICNKELFFDSGNKRQRPHFDHKRGGKELIGSPPSAIYALKITEKRKDLFRKCNFGILCDDCNKFLPTDCERRNESLVGRIK
jgi:hypothetical protein